MFYELSILCVVLLAQIKIFMRIKKFFFPVSTFKSLLFCSIELDFIPPF